MESIDPPALVAQISPSRAPSVSANSLKIEDLAVATSEFSLTTEGQRFDKSKAHVGKPRMYAWKAKRCALKIKGTSLTREACVLRQEGTTLALFSEFAEFVRGRSFVCFRARCVCQSASLRLHAFVLPFAERMASVASGRSSLVRSQRSNVSGEVSRSFDFRHARHEFRVPLLQPA